ncbi:MAG TPA: type II secretion system protein [Verrucomicrobiae bacterium]|nr:type II secretion system protein [Verrucomicrobiae bacterium]
MTLVEAVVVLCVIAFLLTLMLPTLSSSRCNKCQKISCANNLKQLGLAIKVWAGDNNDRYPTAVSTNSGGALEWMTTPEAWRMFQVISNEASTPKIFYCPEDHWHARDATNFTDDLKDHLSYFIGIDATDSNTSSLLGGDDNFVNQGASVKPGLFTTASTATFTWDNSRHTVEKDHAWIYLKKPACGNLLMADGNVQAALNSDLTNYLSPTALATNRLVIP